MRSLLLIPALTLSASVVCAQAGAPDRAAAAKPSAAQSASDPQWGPVPSALPAGAQIAVMQGDPFGDGLYTVRLKLPKGYTVPPHFHPTDEMVTVISGDFQIGMGDRIDKRTMQTLKAGGFVTAGAGMHHYAMARGETVVQIHGQGPFAITYVNPTDDPRQVGKGNP